MIAYQFFSFYSFLSIIRIFAPQPPMFLKFLSFPPFKLFNIDLTGLLTVLSPCELGHIQFTQKFLLHISILPILAVVAVLACVVALLLRSCCCKTRFQPKSAKQRVRSTLAFMVFLLYPGMSVKIFQMFKCREFDRGEWYLVADLSIKCNEGIHSTYRILAMICVVVFIGGIPIGAYLLLHFNKKALHDPQHQHHQAMVRQYGSLFEGYEPKYFYWESLEMLKKCALTGGLVLVAPGSSVQILSGTLIALTYLLFVLKLEPYEDDDDDLLQFLTTLQIMITLLIGFALKTSSPETGVYEDGAMGILLVGTSTFVIAVTFWVFLITFPATLKPLAVIFYCLKSRLVRKKMKKKNEINDGNDGSNKLVSVVPIQSTKNPVQKQQDTHGEKKATVGAKRGNVLVRRKSSFNMVHVKKALVAKAVDNLEIETVKAHDAAIAQIKQREIKADARVRQRLAERQRKKSIKVQPVVTPKSSKDLSAKEKEKEEKSPGETVVEMVNQPTAAMSRPSTATKSLPLMPSKSKKSSSRTSKQVPDVSTTQDDPEIAEIKKILLDLVKKPKKMRAIFQKLDREHSHGLTKTEFHLFVASACKKVEKELKEIVFEKLWKLIDHFKVEDHDELEESAIEKWLFA